MFDTFSGLPVHPLAVHAVVVLMPLMSVVTIAVAVRPAWRRFGIYVLGVDVVVFLATGVAWFSGRALYHRIGQFGRNDLAAKHVGYGTWLPLFAVGLVVAALLVVLAARRPALGPVAVVVAVVAGLAGIGWTVVTGDSGARAVWEQTVKNTTGP